MNLFENLMLQAAAPGGSGMMFPIMMVGMILIMYFFMIRPQQKKAKEAKKFADNIQQSEKIVTTSGLHGRIIRFNDDGTVVIEIARNIEITIERQAISMELTQALHKRMNAVGNPIKTA